MIELLHSQQHSLQVLLVNCLVGNHRHLLLLDLVLLQVLQRLLVLSQVLVEFERVLRVAEDALGLFSGANGVEVRVVFEHELVHLGVGLLRQPRTQVLRQISVDVALVQMLRAQLELPLLLRVLVELLGVLESGTLLVAAHVVGIAQEENVFGAAGVAVDVGEVENRVVDQQVVVLFPHVLHFGLQDRVLVFKRFVEKLVAQLLLSLLENLDLEELLLVVGRTVGISFFTVFRRSLFVVPVGNLELLKLDQVFQRLLVDADRAVDVLDIFKELLKAIVLGFDGNFKYLQLAKLLVDQNALILVLLVLKLQVFDLNLQIHQALFELIEPEVVALK